MVESELLRKSRIVGETDGARATRHPRDRHLRSAELWRRQTYTRSNVGPRGARTVRTPDADACYTGSLDRGVV